MIRPLHAHEIVPANKQRIRHQDLRARRGVVQVVIANQRVAQRGCQLAANVFQLVRIFRRPVNQRPQVDFAFVIHVLVHEVPKRQRVLLGTGHGIARKLNI